MEKETRCYCDDGSLIPILAKESSEGWYLHSLSKIHGMGSGEWNNIMLDYALDDIEIFNGSGLSYIAISKNDKWGLIEVREPISSAEADSKPEYNRIPPEGLHTIWKIVAEIEYDTLEEAKTFMSSRF